MRFKGRVMKDWQEQVWEAKEKIYLETKNMDFKSYLDYIRKGASDFINKQKAKIPTNTTENR